MSLTAGQTELTRSLRASSYQEATRSVNEWAALFVQNPDVGELFLSGVSKYDSLDEVQRNRFHHLLAMHLRNYSVALRLSGEKLLPAAICLAYEAFIQRFMASAELRRWWASNEKYFAEQLRSRMRELLAADDASQRASTPGDNRHD